MITMNNAYLSLLSYLKSSGIQIDPMNKIRKNKIKKIYNL